MYSREDSDLKTFSHYPTEIVRITDLSIEPEPLLRICCSSRTKQIFQHTYQRSPHDLSFKFSKKAFTFRLLACTESTFVIPASNACNELPSKKLFLSLTYISDLSVNPLFFSQRHKFPPFNKNLHRIHLFTSVFGLKISSPCPSLFSALG